MLYKNDTNANVNYFNRNFNIYSNTIISRFFETSTQETMSQEGEGSTLGQSDRSTGSGSATHDDSTIATAGSTTTTISDHETAPDKVPDGRTEDKLCENVVEKNEKPTALVTPNIKFPKKISGLDHKVKQYILGDDTYPASRFREDYLWRKMEEQVRGMCGYRQVRWIRRPSFGTPHDGEF